MLTRSYPCRLNRVIDGDTVRVDVDHGFYIHSTQTVRLVGVNSPERYAAGGAAAKAFVVQWLAGGVEQWPLVLVAFTTVDKYGRRLGRIVREGADLGDALVVNGHGVRPLDG